MTRLINSNVTDMLNEVNQYKKTVQDVFYQHYKNIYELTETNNFRGKGVEAYKEYLKIVTINYINAFINISDQVSTTLEKMNSSYTSLESSEKGSIDTDILNDVRKNLSEKNENLQSLAAEIDSLNDEASSYISVKNLNTLDIIEEYSNIDSELCNITKELNEIDSSSLVEANKLMDRIDELTYQLKSIANDYHEDNKISADKVKEITAKVWYKAEGNEGLNAMIKEDPFSYVSSAKYASEGQWARGFASDAFIYGGHSGFGGEYSGSVNNGVTSGDLTYSIFNAYESAKITDYLKQNANTSLGALSFSGKRGLSKDYFGIQGKGSVAVVDANVSVVLGTENCKGYITGNATALSANGYVNGYYQASNGDFDIGIGGEASAAKASIAMGGSIFNIPGKEKSEKYAGGKVKVSKTTSILGVSIAGEAGVSGGVDFDVSSTRVLDFGEINVNALQVKLKGCLGIGAEVDITIPIPTTDMPWED